MVEGDTNLINALCTHGADASCQDIEKQSVLHLCVILDRNDVLEVAHIY